MMLLLCFDIRGAFNHSWWPFILSQLKNKSCPKNIFKVMQSYFKDRIIIAEAGDEQIRYKMERGSPQGSVMGPNLWNLIYDDLLQMEQPLGVDMTCFADDLIITIEGHNIDVLKCRAGNIINILLRWIKKLKSSLTLRKQKE